MEDILKTFNKNKQLGSSSGISSLLLSKDTLRLTLAVWMCWIINNIVYFGLSFILPMTLSGLKLDANKQSEEGGDIWNMTLATLGELPSTFLLTFILGTFGWRTSLIISYGFTSLLSALLLTGVFSNYFTLLVTLMKLLMNLAFSTGYVFTVQIYPTEMRASGIGAASTVSRIGSILMPWIVLELHKTAIFYPYLFFGALCSVATYLATSQLNVK